MLVGECIMFNKTFCLNNVNVLYNKMGGGPVFIAGHSLRTLGVYSLVLDTK